MEASTAGQPPAGVEAPQTPDPAQAAPEAAPQAPAGGEDFQAKYNEALQRAEAAEGQLAQYQEGQPSDLVSALQGSTGEDFAGLGFTPEEMAALQQDPQFQQPGVQQPGYEQQTADAQFAALNDYVQEMVQQGVQQGLTPFMEERQNDQLNALQQKYPDIMQPEVFGAVKDKLLSLGQRLGAQDIHLNPQAVEMAYMAVQAQRAEAAQAGSPESGATNGASIETNGGQTQQGDRSPEQTFTEAMLASSSKEDPFLN